MLTFLTQVYHSRTPLSIIVSCFNTIHFNNTHFSKTHLNIFKAHHPQFKTGIFSEVFLILFCILMYLIPAT
jgi:hypothetical protein